MGIPTSQLDRPDSWGWFIRRQGDTQLNQGIRLPKKLWMLTHDTVWSRRTSSSGTRHGKFLAPKNFNISMANLNGVYIGGSTLRSRGIQTDPQCMRCGMAAETINHMVFECPPALQVWALSPIPTAINRFPTEGLFTNMAHLFWNLPDDDRMRMYPWLIWFIWKARNDKVFSNEDWDPYEIINHAAAEASAWALAQTRQGVVGLPLTDTVNSGFRGDRCQVDGAWKETDPRAGLGTCNLWRGVSSLQTEVEALLWAMQCMLRHNKLVMVFETDCSDVVHMVSKPEEWPVFAVLLEEIDICRRRFTSFSITHISRTNNTKADKLARSARALPTNVYYVNSVLLTWISEL
ncbi:unnamed protein product [Microthlaspi erraticum]|uniref:RNase H type-1 domain-containing protein n=1 Tax=Microthlaspi erraticum TaxID=1685480 RepID=A0A6D2HSY1_9BRAS|nr:unnamed protein product [Microthlaspi erraticum]